MTVTSPQPEIEDMIARIAMGDRKAFGTLYAHTSAKLFGICLRVLGDRVEAEEALQEAYLRVWTNAETYRANGCSPMTWLITIARNISIDRRRRRLRTRGGGLGMVGELPDPGPGPEAQTIARDDGDPLQMCLNELPPDCAMMVQCAYLDGDSYLELSDRSGVKLNIVRIWLRRSLLQLRECLTR